MERDPLEDQSVDGRRSGMWGIDWIDLAQNRNRWQALVQAVMNLQVP
jgi:hypothetical protein